MKKPSRYSLMADEVDMMIYEFNNFVPTKLPVKKSRLLSVIEMLCWLSLVPFFYFIIHLEKSPINVPPLMFKIFACVASVEIVGYICLLILHHDAGANGSEKWRVERLNAKYDYYSEKKSYFMGVLEKYGIGPDIGELERLRKRLVERNPEQRNTDKNITFTFSTMTLMIALVCLFGEDSIQSQFLEYNLLWEIPISLYLVHRASDIFSWIMAPENYIYKHDSTIDDMVMIIDGLIVDIEQTKKEMRK